MGAPLLAAILVVVGAQAPGEPVRVPAVAAPVVSLWYRGSPPGTPRREDLEAIRAAGFSSITWPSHDAAGVAAVSRLATDLQLSVTLRIASTPMTPATAKTPERAVDLAVGDRGERIAALAWRAVAHGATSISLDTGAASGTVVGDARGPRPWVAPALAVLRQFTTDARLLLDWRPFATIDTGPASKDALDLCLLEDARSWVLVVTNASGARAKAVAHFPAGVPAALWVNLIDGGLLSMIAGPGGPRWTLDLEPWAARVYVVSKAVRATT